MSTQPNTTDLDPTSALNELLAMAGRHMKVGPHAQASFDGWAEMIRAALARRSQPVAATQQAAREGQQESVATEGVAGLRPYEFSVCGTSLRWYRKEDVDAILAAPVIAQQSEAGDPLDWPIPCDLVDGAVTLKKGVKLRTVLTRLKFLSGLCKANLPKAYQYDVEHPNDGLNGQPTEAGAPTAAAELPENWQNDVQTAWRCVRKYNNTIPDATLDLMRDMLLAAPTSGRESAALGAQQDAKDAGRYRWLREQRGIEGDLPLDGDVWVVQLHQPRGVIPELRCAGFGGKLDRAVDAAMQKGAQDNG